ncbi:MAG: DegT/DnrJ/EryC1/StrS family aminotransferase [Bacteroidia bacterium]|nr:DegT/DnrJ/EryC1/StrS family aminotransferase [Bacteroidia bacterium]
MSFEVPYHRAIIGNEEIEAVTAALRSGWLTMGSRVTEFEERISRLKGGCPTVAVSSCTAGLFLALKALDLPPGSEVITTPYTFAATANVIHQNGLVPVFADIDPLTLNLDPDQVEARINLHTRAILPVHLGGNPCDMEAFSSLADSYGLSLIEDCAHALEGEFGGKPLGTFGVAGSFSFYPTKNITTAEGGLITTSSDEFAHNLRLLRNHGLDRSAHARENLENSHQYDILLPGYKYTLSDLQAALGLAQLERLEAMYERRAQIARAYDAAFGDLKGVSLIPTQPGGKSALHLYMLKLDLEAFNLTRNQIMARINAAGIQLSVNYQPVHLFTWYRQTYGHQPGDFPQTELAGESTFSLPFYPALTDEQVGMVTDRVRKVLCEAAG